MSFREFLEAKTAQNLLRQTRIDIWQMRDHSLTNSLGFDLGQLKHQSICDMPLLNFRLALIELTRLAVVIREQFSADFALFTADLFWI